MKKFKDISIKDLGEAYYNLTQEKEHLSDYGYENMQAFIDKFYERFNSLGQAQRTQIENNVIALAYKNNCSEGKAFSSVYATKEAIDLYTNDLATRSQKANKSEWQAKFNMLNSNEVNKLMACKKEPIGEVVNGLFEPQEGSAKQSQEISTQYLKGKSDSKNVIFAYVTRKFSETERDGVVRKSNVQTALYVLPEGKSEEATLLYRLDLSRHHENKVIPTSNKEYFEDKVCARHFHFANCLTNLLYKCKPNVRTQVCALERAQSNAISTEKLSQYLKDLDSCKDLSKMPDLGLPFKAMKEKGVVLNCDLDKYTNAVFTNTPEKPDDLNVKTKEKGAFTDLANALKIDAKINKECAAIQKSGNNANNYTESINVGTEIICKSISQQLQKEGLKENATTSEKEQNPISVEANSENAFINKEANKVAQVACKQSDEEKLLSEKTNSLQGSNTIYALDVGREMAIASNGDK